MAGKTNTGSKLKRILLLIILLEILAASAALLGSVIMVFQNTAAVVADPYAPSVPTAPTAAVESQTYPTEPETTEPPTTLPPEPEHVISTATIGATGDMLMHMPVVNSAQQNGAYNFDYIFQYLQGYSVNVDYSVTNLETTLCSNTNGYQYSGYPQFNCPDEIVDGLLNAGFDMLLTANNHSYDTGKTGYMRTLETARSKGMDTLGTMLTPEDSKYEIVDINGIRIGMICYTYEGRPAENYIPNRVYLNGIPMFEGGEDYINSFLPTNLDPFYNEIAVYLDEMKAMGAEATVVFLHWGVEYTTTPVAHQFAIAQKLCDLGVDVIIGGHPHVVEPVQLLTSQVDPEHKTVCLYSMGNAVSNQRSTTMTSQPSGHTEDGVFFTATFSKYSDGTVYLEDVDLIPCWVDLRTSNGRQYFILPLDTDSKDYWKSIYDMTDASYGAALRSYDRTMAIVGAGLAESRSYLAEQKDLREAYYLAEVVNLMYSTA